MEKENYSTNRIMDMDVSERPRERLEKGFKLKKEELLAILLHVGVEGESALDIARKLITKYGGFSGLQRASFQELIQEHGIGRAKACTIKAAIQIGEKLIEEKSENRQTIHNPDDIYQLVSYEMSALPQEHLRVVCLDTRNHILNIENLYIGTVNSSTVRIAEIFKPAIQRCATSIILVHNHPSGDPTPSPEDIQLTRNTYQAGKLLDIELLDHVVIGSGSFISLKERGVGFT